MSHELRTPLNGVLGMAHAMARGELSAPQRERLSAIKTSGESLLSLIDDLFDLTMLEAGGITLDRGVVCLQDLVDGALSAFLEKSNRKGLGLDLHVTPGARGHWVGDSRRLRQLLHNLIANAVKFTDHGSIRVEFRESGRGIQLRVTDTGVGIPASALGDVFDQFFQVDASASRRNGGSGLGLTICRGLVRLMMGDIRVESIQGQGSAFFVDLPLTRAEATPPEAPTPDEVSDWLQLRVLTAEDNEINQRVIRSLLGAAGIETFMVANGQEAVAAWRAAPWDIVLMDIQMPVMDGIAATKLMRRVELEEHRARTPIIAVTANAMTHHEEAYLSVGMDAMVAKPIDFGTLIRAIDAALQLEGARS
jgi:CheY-like chemotaxis protein